MDTFVNLFYRFGNGSIILVAAINSIIFVLTLIAEKKMEELFHPKGDSVRKANSGPDWDDDNQIVNLENQRKRMMITYAWYANITSIFPLLGILGTVAALVKEVDDIEGLTGNFMVALSTTFWGIFFAIIFKGIDAMISGPMESVNQRTDLVIQQHDSKELQKNERKEAQECNTAE